MVPTPLHCLKAVSSERSLGAGKASKIHISSQGGGGEEPLVAWIQTTASDGRILLVTSPNTPPFMTSSYDLTCMPHPFCTVSFVVSKGPH